LCCLFSSLHDNQRIDINFHVLVVIKISGTPRLLQLNKNECFALFRAFAEYNRDQYIPTKVQGVDEECLITDANDLGDSRFYDPRTRQSFKYDCLLFNNIYIYLI